jgi:hypothetical protein
MILETVGEPLFRKINGSDFGVSGSLDEASRKYG